MSASTKRKPAAGTAAAAVPSFMEANASGNAASTKNPTAAGVSGNVLNGIKLSSKFYKLFSARFFFVVFLTSQVFIFINRCMYKYIHF